VLYQLFEQHPSPAGDGTLLVIVSRQLESKSEIMQKTKTKSLPEDEAIGD
jgi:hypothetical protein